MCKHKSGGMSKPPGTSSQEGASASPAAPITSQICPQSTTGATAAQDTFGELSRPKRKYASLPTVHALPSVAPCNNRLCDTYNNFLPVGAEPLYMKQYESMSLMPNIQETRQELLETQDSDEDTEQSPMLLNDAGIFYECAQESWGATGEELNKNVLSADQYNPCDVYPYSSIDTRNQAIDCDNVSSYYNYNAQANLQDSAPYMQAHSASAVCPSYFESMDNYTDMQMTDLNNHGYNSKPKRKWLMNQKCKSADSDPNSYPEQFMPVCRKDLSPAGYNYAPGQSTNILETHNTGHNSYMKSMYVNNGDPIAGPSGLQRPCSINWEMGLNSVDNEFRSRSYSLTPTVNFAVFEAESSSETEDVQEPMVPDPVHEMELPNCMTNTKTVDDIFEFHNMPLGKVIPISPSAAQLSIASSYGDNGSPICKICHMTGKENDPLISPCRCSGTMQYIHCGCLMRWLEVCHKRGRRPASCELCQYQYHWHKKFKVRHWQFPQCSRKDKILHLLFIFSALLMISCAALTIMFFKHDKGTKMDMNQELTESEIGNLVCGVLFFVAFFVAIYVEAKSHDTLYKLLVKFIHINQQWYIDEYEKKETPPVAV